MEFTALPLTVTGCGISTKGRDERYPYCYRSLFLFLIQFFRYHIVYFAGNIYKIVGDIIIKNKYFYILWSVNYEMTSKANNITRMTDGIFS